MTNKLLLVSCLSAGTLLAADQPFASILTRDGQTMEGTLSNKTLRVTVGGRTREIAPGKLLSIQIAKASTGAEEKRITDGLAAVAGADRKARDLAVADLTDIGLPVMTPLLTSYKDTDLREPAASMRLFSRVVPGYADGLDRTLDLIRLSDGENLRGELSDADLRLVVAGKPVIVPVANVRRLAVRQREISRSFDVHALRHATQIDFLDSGLVVTPESKLDSSAIGFVRLAFAQDGWGSDPDGLKVPGPNYKTNLVDGLPFGALVARVGPAGEVWTAGSHVSKTGVGAGRLYFAVNDNKHWQNNIGSFRVKLRVTDAYDVGDAQ